MAVELARQVGPPKNVAWALSFLGRARLLLGDLGGARASLEVACEISRNSWPYFVPWTNALLAEVELIEGGPEQALATFEHAFALGCQIGDPCWEAMGQRGLGLCAIRSGRGQKGIDLLEDAYRRARRFADAYLWVAANCLESLAAAAVACLSPRAAEWVADLASLSARTGMRELLVIAQLHKAALGDPIAMEAASTIAADVDSPRLRERLASHAGSHA